MYKIILACLLVSNISFAQTRSPLQIFQNEIHQRYRRQYKKADIDKFLTSAGIDQLRNAESILKGDAIRLAVLFGDYYSLLSLSNEEIKQVSKQMITLLNGPFYDFWHNSQLKQKTKDILFQNPKLFASLLDILEELAKSPDADTFKRLLSKKPDYLLYLYHLPVLVEIPEERLPVLLHFLQYVDFSKANKNKKQVEHLDNLNCFIKKWYDRLIPLYLANFEKYGPSGGMTLWAAEDFFSNGPKLDDDLQKNQQIWELLIGQIRFILDKQRDSLDWQNDQKNIAALLNRIPTSGEITEVDWREFLRRTNQANGKALELLWEMKDKESNIKEVERFLGFLKGREIPYSVVLNLMKCSKTAADFLYLIELAMDDLYKVTSRGEDKKSSTIPLPIIIMSELENDDGYKFINMHKKHGHQLIAYLNDSAKGKNVQDRFNLALKTDLADAQYDESTLKKLITLAPGGNMINVVIKSYQGYPVSGIEYTLAVLDVANFALYVATGGGSEVLKTGGKEAVKKSGKEVVKKGGKETVKKTVPKFTSSRELWDSLRELAKQAPKQIDIVNEIKTVYDDYRSKTDIAKREHEFLIKINGTVSNDIVAADLYKRFSSLPLYEFKQRSHSFNQIKNTPSIVIQMPENNGEWLKALDGDADCNPILLMMLADFYTAK